MNRLEINYKGIEIEYGFIKPFINICKVTGVREYMNVTIKYIPNKYVLEIGSYRDYFKNDFNEFIESLCCNVYDHIEKLIEPKKLEVILYLIDKNLTPWQVKKTSY